MIQCSFCSSTVPESRYCLNCNTNLGVVEIPKRDPSPTGRLGDAAAGADHPSVTFATLRSKHDQYDRPLGSYLFEDEQPRLILDVGSVAVESYTGRTWKIRPGFRRRGHALVTDRRMLVVSPSEPGDQLYELRFEEAVTAETGSSWLDDTLSVELVDGSSVTLSVAGLTDEELSSARDRIEELVRANDSAESRTAAFVREVDAVVADATDAESALRAAADLFAERDDDSVFDHHVAQADSVESLFARLSDDVGGDSDPRPDDADGDARGDAPLPTPRIDAPSLRRNVERAFREGDPKEAGKWAIGAGIAGFSVAVSMPFSTAAGLGAIALSGAATGAYASANPDSVAARIDPIEMAIGAKTRGRQWERGSAPGGAGVGSAVGVAEHVADRTSDTEYARWYANVDPELVLRGAELGARTADSSPHFRNRTAAALLGGGFGLAYGYSGLDEDDEDVAALLGRDPSEILSSEGEGVDAIIGEAESDEADDGTVVDDAEDDGAVIDEAEDDGVVVDDAEGDSSETESRDDGGDAFVDADVRDVEDGDDAGDGA